MHPGINIPEQIETFSKSQNYQDMGNICRRKSYWLEINCREYIGLSLEEATKKAHKNHLHVHLTSLEGENYSVPMDWQSHRIKFAILGGKVVNCEPY